MIQLQHEPGLALAGPVDRSMEHDYSYNRDVSTHFRLAAHSLIRSCGAAAVPSFKVGATGKTPP